VPAAQVILGDIADELSQRGSTRANQEGMARIRSSASMWDRAAAKRQDEYEDVRSARLGRLNVA